MNKLITIVLLIFLMSSCKSLKVDNDSTNDTYFKVEVVQNGKVIKEKNNVIKLEKKPFKFRLTYFKTDHIFASFSWGTYYYDFPKGKIKSESHSQDGVSWSHTFNQQF